MPRSDKLKLLEALWEDLSRSEDFESPAWHEQVLKETEQRVAEGKERIIDWQSAKKRLREK